MCSAHAACTCGPGRWPHTHLVGEQVEGEVSIKGRDVVAALDPIDASGSYTIAYRLVSADAHTVKGTLDFEVAPPATASPAPSPTASPTPSPELTEDPVTTTPVEDSGGDAMSAVIVIAFFFVALAVLFFMIRAGMRAGGRAGDE